MDHGVRDSVVSLSTWISTDWYYIAWFVLQLSYRRKLTNPHGIVPALPDLNYEEPHNRATLTASAWTWTQTQTLQDQYVNLLSLCFSSLKKDLNFVESSCITWEIFRFQNALYRIFHPQFFTFPFLYFIFDMTCINPRVRIYPHSVIIAYYYSLNAQIDVGYIIAKF